MHEIDQDFENDIPRELATSAHRGTSHTPERRAEQEIAGYADQLRADSEIYRAEVEKAHDAGNTKLVADYAEAWAAYRAGYAKRTRAMLEAKSRCISTLVTGPANFNTSRARKASDSADRYRQAAEEFRVACLREMRRIVFPNEAPVACGDVDAVERLRAKIEEAEKFQTRAKEINAAIRKAKTGNYNPITALRAIDISHEEAVRLITPDALGNIGIPAYKLTNNGAEIRRLKARIEAVSKAKATPTVEEFHVATSIVLTDAPADNRVRLRFPGKPDEATRASLKRNGFRWAPTVEGGVWQAYRTPRAIEFAKEIAAKGSP